MVEKKGVNIIKEEILDNFTIECPECGYTLFGDEPRYIIECDICLKKKHQESEVSNGHSYDC